LGLSLWLVGCGKNTGHNVPTLTGASVKRSVNSAQIDAGHTIYMQHCAVCHGPGAQGAPNWQRRRPDGGLPPPPLNGSGHAWHHDRLTLKYQIRFGSNPNQGNMPAFNGKLSNADIEAVIAYFQSLWPDEIYAKWYDAHGSALPSR